MHIGLQQTWIWQTHNLPSALNLKKNCKWKKKLTKGSMNLDPAFSYGRKYCRPTYKPSQEAYTQSIHFGVFSAE